jgi:hypothetical protein
MVKLKLNDNYSNDFLTTLNGVAFFKEWKKQNRAEWVEINDNNFNKNIELKNLVNQGTLIRKKEDKIEIKKEDKIEIKKDKTEIKKDKTEIKKDNIEIKKIENKNTKKVENKKI